jgi:NADH-quinone oxidoreductase subunit I
MSAKPHRRKAYWNQPTMGWWERFYLFEIVRGLSITGGVFVRNLWSWMRLRKGALTTYYPEEVRADYARRNRGKHVLTQRPDGRPQCIACNLCATVCPAKCIEIEAMLDVGDPAHPKSPGRFEIDYGRCIFCGLCVEACPTEALLMTTEYEISGDSRDGLIYTKDQLIVDSPILRHWKTKKELPPDVRVPKA